MLRSAAICVLCGSVALREVPSYSEILSLPGNTESRVLGCGDCGLLMLHPPVSADLVGKLYAESYFTGAANPDLGVPGFETTYADIARARQGKFGETLDLLERYVRPGARLLD